MMTDTLKGLSYMHGIASGPIAHGDIKLVRRAHATALICDFGRSSHPKDLDRPHEFILSSSSPFAGTVRYMSPELLLPESAIPSPAADMWAYGCISLEILCRIQPYNETNSDAVVAELIRTGHLPSNRPYGPRGRLVNDTLWGLLSSCWQAQDWRPTAQIVLEELTRLVESGQVNSPIPMDLFSVTGSEPMPAWPAEIKDLNDQLKSDRLFVRSRSPRATIWRATMATNQWVVIKVPRLNASIENQARHDHLEYIYRKVASSRYGVHHPNIIDFLGITSGFSPHEGLVFEECYEWRLDEMCDILEGLKYMHGYPVPIPHGDLIPENISVDDSGRAKISLMSFGRILAALPLEAGVTATAESVLSLRWMSPELVTVDDPQPTTESDIWTFGCVCFWLLTHREPYSSIKRDDLAGAEIMRDKPPAIPTRSDYRAFWTTNGLWNAIARCWRKDPLQRPTATEFMKLLTQLEGRNMALDWLPVSVADLAGKVRFNISERREYKQIASHSSVWRRFKDMEEEILEEVKVRMVLYEAMYAPKWYTKSTKVAIKAPYSLESDDITREAVYSGIRYEVALMAQVDHPSIHKLLGIDSSPTPTHPPHMVFEPLPLSTLQRLIDKGKTNYYTCIPILSDVASAITYLHELTAGSIAHGDIQPANILVYPDGRAKLANFTCAFQYISNSPASPRHLSGAISVPPQPSLHCSPESRDPFAFPSLAGDVWSFGTVILSTFSPLFRATDSTLYALQLEKNISPLDSGEIIADCDARVLPLLRSMLIVEPASRATMTSVLSRLSNN
ncbi:Putative serine/threonine-protein kinase/receptor R826 [Rhizoctonia solani]|uniref:Putative serine/threonine-protein kinase/receptor R826 n=1 Tax=Rhizoctonia solani TaxID=456999 RepID=A0A0K6G585_9AGAM|nr:Putative serine/threonine-protein kinase/receptor R826 [Rhizoctonia solani]